MKNKQLNWKIVFAIDLIFLALSVFFVWDIAATLSVIWNVGTSGLISIGILGTAILLEIFKFAVLSK